MRTILITLLLLGYLTSGQAQLPVPVKIGEKLEIGFNKNIEFLGFMYFITYEGTNIETKMLDIDGRQVAEKDWQSYGYAFYQKYKQYASSRHAVTAMGIAEHLWLSNIIPLLLQTSDFPNARLTTGINERYYLPFSKDKNAQQAMENAERFLRACNELYREVDFDGYLSSSEKYYQAALIQLKASVPSTDFITYAEKFYRRSFDSYALLPSLTLPKGMGFGPRLQSGNRTAVYSVFGAVGFQQFSDMAALNMGFGNLDKVREMGIHEFGHSFVNPEFEAFTAERIAQTSPLFESMRSTMELQGYNNWAACLNEHLVRAGEIMIAVQMGNTSSAERLRAEYVNGRKFSYLPLIIDELGRFSKDSKDTYQRVIERVLSALEKKLPQKNGTTKALHFSDEPRKATLHTEDIELFWKIFDGHSPGLTGELLQQAYLDKGSVGLKGMIKNRIESGKNLARVLREQLDYYKYVRPFTLTIGEKKDRIYRCFENLKNIYPKAVFPDVYFVIGANNSGGTIFEQGLIVGAERLGTPSSIHSPALNIEDLEELVAHELVHFQQNYPKDNSLLAQCILEGSADFICELIAGGHSNKNIYKYAEAHKQELWNEFQSKMNGSDWTGWLYYSKDATRKDVGYYMGYQICKAYYDRATDKNQAVWEILNIRSFGEFFTASGFNGR